MLHIKKATNTDFTMVYLSVFYLVLVDRNQKSIVFQTVISGHRLTSHQVFDTERTHARIDTGMHMY